MPASSSHGAASRRPVSSGNRRVPGLYERTLANGSTVYEAALRLGGQVRRRRLAAGTKTDAITELRALQVDFDRERLLAAMGDTFRPVAAVCAYAGLRVSEALGLRWRDVDLKAGTVTVTAQLGLDGERVPVKTAASAATVPMLPVLAAELRAHRSRVAERALARMRPDGLVFTTSRGRPHGCRNVLRAVYAAGDAAGLNGDGRERVGVHDLRHSFVAIALAAGLTLPEAAALARHANPRITATVYAGLTDRGREQLGARLAEAFGS